MRIIHLGPYVTAALLCENVIEDRDGALSVIRVIDVVNVNIPPGLTRHHLASAQMSFTVTMLISLIPGHMRGKKHLSIILTRPSQEQSPSEYALPVVFEGGDRRVNLVLPINVQVKEEGLHWFDIQLDGQFITRIPLTIRFVPVQGG